MQPFAIFASGHTSLLDYFTVIFPRNPTFYAIMQSEDSDVEASGSWTERIFAFIAKYAKLNEQTGLETMRILYNPENNWFTQTRPMQKKLSSLIAGAQENRELASSLVPEEITDILYVCMRGICYDWCISNGAYDLEERMSYRMALLLRAFQQ